MTSAQVDEIAAAFEVCTARSGRLAASVPLDQLARRPREDSWSAAECVVHLTITTRTCLPSIAAAIERLRSTGGATSRRSTPGFLGRLLAWTLEPPARMRSRTPPAFVPGAGEAPERALPDFVAEQQRLLALLRGAAGLDLGTVKVVSPFDARVRYDALSAFLILAAHQRRHLWQAERALAALA